MSDYNEMTEEQQTALTRWIAVNVMNYIPCRGDYWLGAHNPGMFNCPLEKVESWAFEYAGGGNTVDASGKTYCGMATYKFKPLEDEAEALIVLKACVEKLELDRAYPAIQKYSDLDGFQGWQISALYATRNQRTFSTVAATLEACICLFAKEVYTKCPQK